MGDHDVRRVRDERDERAFMRAVLRDLEALETMLEHGMLEHGVRRVGVEQELFLVDGTGRPALLATEVLERLDDARFTTELARFNLEANLDPGPLDPSFLRRMEADLSEALEQVRCVSEPLGATPLLVGILPTLRRGDLGPDAMTPEPRYRMLEEGIRKLRGGPVPVFIRGIDELHVESDSVMLESANTSLQLHLQVDEESFAACYNAAQLASAPLLAAAVGSPLLFGRRLWQETRVALFEGSVDARTDVQRARGQRRRVTFGERWVRESPLELYREDAARCRVLLARDVQDDPGELVERGEVPPLSALRLHNGTVWRWNRACLDVGAGVATLRIENRVLPAGPTVVDEVANAALFYGLVLGLPARVGDPADLVPFDTARESFLHAARYGLDARIAWLSGRRVAVRDLLLEELLPLARETLAEAGVPAGDLDRYLGVVEERVRTEQTLSRWLLDAVGDGPGPIDARAHAATEELIALEVEGKPVHEWPPSRRRVSSAPASLTVGELMTSDLISVRPEDVIDLATKVMEWKDLHHIPVEGGDGVVVGLVTHEALMRRRDELQARGEATDVAVRDVMEPDPPIVDVETPVAEAYRELAEAGAGCLLVLEDGRLAGIVTEHDLARAQAGSKAGP